VGFHLRKQALVFFHKLCVLCLQLLHGSGNAAPLLRVPVCRAPALPAGLLIFKRFNAAGRRVNGWFIAAVTAIFRLLAHFSLTQACCPC
jgi:hypothetical protein